MPLLYQAIQFWDGVVYGRTSGSDSYVLCHKFGSFIRGNIMLDPTSID